MEHSDFYATPVPMTAEDTVKLREVIARKGTFDYYSGQKECGGYHPDFAVRWVCDDEEMFVHFCFGCDEAKIFYGKRCTHCDLTSEGRLALRSILLDYHENLPEPNSDG